MRVTVVSRRKEKIYVGVGGTIQYNTMVPYLHRWDLHVCMYYLQGMYNTYMFVCMYDRIVNRRIEDRNTYHTTCLLLYYCTYSYIILWYKCHTIDTHNTNNEPCLSSWVLLCRDRFALVLPRIHMSVLSPRCWHIVILWKWDGAVDSEPVDCLVVLSVNVSRASNPSDMMASTHVLWLHESFFQLLWSRFAPDFWANRVLFDSAVKLFRDRNFRFISHLILIVNQLANNGFNIRIFLHISL